MMANINTVNFPVVPEKFGDLAAVKDYLSSFRASVIDAGASDTRRQYYQIDTLTTTDINAADDITASGTVNAQAITVGPDNTTWTSPSFQLVNGHVNFASTGTWRTVAQILFASTNYAGGYLLFGFGGVENNVGSAKAFLAGTFDKSGAGNPTFTSISNVVTNCAVQAAADGATKLVVQMESTSGANTVMGNFSFLVMGGSIFSMVVSAPGYSD